MNKKNTFSFSLAVLFVTAIFSQTKTSASYENNSPQRQKITPCYIKQFQKIFLTDIPLVGGKNASLGQMINELSNKGIRVPNGFAITTQAYWHYLSYNNLVDTIKTLLTQISNPQDLATLKEVSSQIRTHIEQGTIPADLAQEIRESYQHLSEQYQETACDVAVRSSATTEDLANASFAGQQDTFLHVHTIEQLFTCYKKCIASLFTEEQYYRPSSFV